VGNRSHLEYRRLANGTVHCAGSATYQIWFRLPIPNPNPKTDTNPNPNPKSNKNVYDTRIKLNVELYINYFPRDRGGFIRGL